MNGISAIVGELDGDRLKRYEQRGLQRTYRVKCESNRITVMYPEYSVVISAYGQTRNDRHGFAVGIEDGRGMKS